MHALAVLQGPQSHNNSGFVAPRPSHSSFATRTPAEATVPTAHTLMHAIKLVHALVHACKSGQQAVGGGRRYWTGALPQALCMRCGAARVGQASRRGTKGRGERETALHGAHEICQVETCRSETVPQACMSLAAGA